MVWDVARLCQSCLPTMKRNGIIARVGRMDKLVMKLVINNRQGDELIYSLADNADHEQFWNACQVCRRQHCCRRGIVDRGRSFPSGPRQHVKSNLWTFSNTPHLLNIAPDVMQIFFGRARSALMHTHMMTVRS